MSAWRELMIYVGRAREFTREDWLVYLVWVGMMVSLGMTVGGFLWVGRGADAPFPGSAYLVVIGIAIFALAIAVDTIGHRTIYKQAIAGSEALVHHVTIAAGITSCVAMSMAYTHRDLALIPAAVLTAVTVLYSLVDEVMHWRRYLMERSDRVEMWSHAFIFLGHGIMMAGWWHWLWVGYPGVPETLAALGIT